MNLLVTNTRNAQAYAIIRALRPYARKVVVTMYGASRLAARLSHAANSRLVDRRCYVPSPVEDWRAGRIQKENTEREEAYIRAILRICEAEEIDTIFPSFDPHVYVFSKNRERFERLGIVIPIPDYEVVVTPLDKYRTIQAAREMGFPCPKTFLPEREEDLKWIAEELGFPAVVKPRFAAAGRGMGIVNSLPELLQKTRLVRKQQGMPIIQEFIPGGEKQMFQLMLDKKGEAKVVFCIKRWRNFFRVSSHLPTADECVGPSAAYVDEAVKVAQTLGWWGGITVQTKIDSRDGVPKLMEINPRLGVLLWYRTELGINEPLMSLKIAKGEEVEAVKHYRLGTMLLWPVEDILGFVYKLLDLLIYKYRVGIKGRVPLDPLNPPMSLRELGRSYKQTYLGKREKVFNPYFRYFFQDPLVSIIWWGQFFALVWRDRRELGK